MNIEQKQRQAINMLLEIEKMYGSDVPCSLVSVLLMIPLSGQIPVTEIRKQSTLTEAGVSRAVSTLNAHNVSNRREIDKLVEILIDDKDSNVKEWQENFGIGIHFPCLWNQHHNMANNPIAYVIANLHAHK